MFENLPKLNGTATVEFIINNSSIIIEVFGNDAPITGGNFVDLVERDVYDGLAFHRVIREPSPFVVQGGDPQSADPNFPIENLGTGGFIDPETGVRRTIPLEIKLEGDEEPTYNTVLGRLAGNPPPDVVLENDRGAIAMARSSAPNSASSQFYFALDELAFLDGDYAVFGEIVEGLDVLDDIEIGDRIEDAEVIEGLENLVPGTNIVLGGFENDFLVGSNGNDRITGGDGDDTLIGVNLNSPESSLGKGERDILVGNRKSNSIGSDTFILGDANNVFYDDGDSLTRGEADLARILGFNSTDDTIQLHGSGDLYSLKFGSVEGRTDARIVYQPENATVGEIIAKIIDVNTDLTLDDSAFVFL